MFGKAELHRKIERQEPPALMPPFSTARAFGLVLFPQLALWATNMPSASRTEETVRTSDVSDVSDVSVVFNGTGTCPLRVPSDKSLGY